MLYAFVRPLAKIGISIFFRRIYLTHTENIPKNRPVILACNHPTAFLEPCILACFLDRPLYYLVRGDLFKKTIYNFLLRALHMLPVFRRRDGDFSSLKNNYATFDACIDALKNNKTLVVFPEGMTVLEYRLRPLQKGIGRISMGLFEKYPDLDELFVVPVGVNYTDAFRFRSDVMIEFGEAIPMRHYYDAHKDLPNEGVVRILDDLSVAMKKEMIIIEKPERDLVGKNMLEMDRSRRADHIWPVLSRDSQALESERAVASMVNTLDAAHLAAIQQSITAYQIQLSRHGITDQTLLKGKIPLGPSIRNQLLLAIPAFFGYWLNVPLVNIARRTVAKRVKRIEYHSPVLVGMSIGIYTAFFLIILLLGLFLKFWLLWALIPFMYLTGKAYITFVHHRNRIRQERKRLEINEVRQQELLKMRLDILSQMATRT